MVLSNILLRRFKVIKLVKTPITLGIAAANEFEFRSRTRNDVRLPIAEEMLPLRPFEARLSEVTAPDGEQDTKLHEHTALSGTPPVHDQPLVKTALRNFAFVAAATEHIAASLTDGVGNCVGIAVGTRVGFRLGRLVG